MRFKERGLNTAHVFCSSLRATWANQAFLLSPGSWPGLCRWSSCQHLDWLGQGQATMVTCSCFPVRLRNPSYSNSLPASPPTPPEMIGLPQEYLLSVQHSSLLWGPFAVRGQLCMWSPLSEWGPPVLTIASTIMASFGFLTCEDGFSGGTVLFHLQVVAGTDQTINEW